MGRGTRNSCSSTTRIYQDHQSRQDRRPVRQRRHLSPLLSDFVALSRQVSRQEHVGREAEHARRGRHLGGTLYAECRTQKRQLYRDDQPRMGCDAGPAKGCGLLDTQDGLAGLHVGPSLWGRRLYRITRC